MEKINKDKLYDISILTLIYLIANSDFLLANKEDISFIIKMILLSSFIVFYFYYIKKHHLPKLNISKIKLNAFKYLPFIILCFSNFIYLIFIKDKSSIFNLKSIIYGFFISLMVAICEEFIFRGIIVSELSIKYNKYKTILYSSLIFGLVHLLNISTPATILPSLIQVGYSFFLGLFLSYLYIDSNNIIFSIILHFLFNFVNNYLVINLYNYNIENNYYLINILVGVFVILFLLVLIMLERKKKNAS